MPRPPLGETAMTAAQRQQRRRERLRQEQAAASPEAEPQTSAPSPNGRQVRRRQSIDYRDGHITRARAEHAGRLYARARDVHRTIQWCSESLRKDGLPVAALTREAMAILEKAAHGKPVDGSLLERVLEAAAQLDQRLTFEVLARFPNPE